MRLWQLRPSAINPITVMRGLERGSAAPPPPLLLTLFALIVSDRINYRTNYRTVHPSRGKNRNSWNTFSSPQKKTKKQNECEVEQGDETSRPDWNTNTSITTATRYDSKLPNWTDRWTSCSTSVWDVSLVSTCQRIDLLIRCIMWPN